MPMRYFFRRTRNNFGGEGLCQLAYFCLLFGLCQGNALPLIGNYYPM